MYNLQINNFLLSKCKCLGWVLFDRYNVYRVCTANILKYTLLNLSRYPLNPHWYKGQMSGSI